MPQRNVYTWTIMLAVCCHCGNLAESRRLFDQMPERNVVSWNAMLAAYAQHGDCKNAIEVFRRMQLAGLMPNNVTFVSVLDACASQAALVEGKKVHQCVIEHGLEFDLVVSTALVKMYGECRCMEECERIFAKMPEKNVVSWNVMIEAYAQCGNVIEAQRVFQQMPECSIVSWNVIIACHTKQLHNLIAFQLLQKMQLEGMQPNHVTFISLFDSCATEVDLARGKVMHALLVQSSVGLDVVSETALLNVYVKCWSLSDVNNIFDRMVERNAVSWNILLGAYAHSGRLIEAQQIFYHMPKKDIFSWNTMVAAYAQSAKLEDAQYYFDIMPEHDVVSWNTMLAGYAKYGWVEAAQRVFDEMPQRNLVSWNTILAGYAQHGHGKEALSLFQQMQQEGFTPNLVTFISVLDACANQKSLGEGKQIHEHIIRSGYESDIVVGTAIVNMYAKCGSLDEACKVFNEMPKRNVVSWNAMITAHAQCGNLDDARMIFYEMPERDAVSWNAMVAAHADSGSLEETKQLFWEMPERNVDSWNVMVAAYARHGSLEDAWEAFGEMPERNIMSCNNIIAAYAQHGQGQKALQCFKDMQLEGMASNKATFISILNACSHAGLVDNGLHLFASMVQNYNISPTLMHFECIIDTLGRLGWLDYAEGLIEAMPFEPTDISWMTLLGGCRKFNDVQCGNHVAGYILTRYFDSHVCLSSSLPLG